MSAVLQVGPKRTGFSACKRQYCVKCVIVHCSETCSRLHTSVSFYNVQRTHGVLGIGECRSASTRTLPVLCTASNCACGLSRSPATRKPTRRALPSMCAISLAAIVLDVKYLWYQCVAGQHSSTLAKRVTKKQGGGEWVEQALTKAPVD